MHIMFMTQCYAPEDVNAAVLKTELAEDLVNRRHQVTMVTRAPNYPHGRAFRGYLNKIYQGQWLSGVRVNRTWAFIFSSKGFWQRIFLLWNAQRKGSFRWNDCAKPGHPGKLFPSPPFWIIGVPARPDLLNSMVVAARRSVSISCWPCAHSPESKDDIFLFISETFFSSGYSGFIDFL
jgi:hypothetical protein